MSAKPACSDLQDVPAGALGDQQGACANPGDGDGTSTQCFGDSVDDDDNPQFQCEDPVCDEVVPDHWEDASLAVLKVGDQAKHPTLVTVTAVQLGSLGATVEFFSNRSKTVTSRRVLWSDIMPLPVSSLSLSLFSSHMRKTQNFSRNSCPRPRNNREIEIKISAFLKES